MSESKGSATLVSVIVEMQDGEPVFRYMGASGERTKGDVTMFEAGTITYHLVDNTNKGLKFIGLGFITPFDGIVDVVTVSADGTVIQVVDLDNTHGDTKFQFVLTNTANTLMLLSPDPQILNIPNT